MRYNLIATLALLMTCSASYGQDGNPGGGDTGTGTETSVGEPATETSDLSGEGITTGPTEQTESGFAGPEESGFAGPGNGGLNINRNFNNINRQSIQSGGSSSQQRAIRPSFRLGFVPSQALISRNRRRAISTFNSITPRVRTLRNVSIAPQQNGAVTLRGQANSRYDLLLAAAIARLQPGVRSIRNEIVIEPQPVAVPLNPGFVPAQPIAPTMAEPPSVPATPTTPLP